MKKRKPYTAAWWRDANALARARVPPIYPCADCGNPVVDGYCCGRCGSRDPKTEGAEKLND